MSTRVLLADDHTIVREGLRVLINALPGVEVVAETADGRATVDVARQLCPDVVVMDLAMPVLNGVDATRQIVASCPGVRVIALSMHSSRKFVLESLRAGASGYVPKESAFEELARAIEAVAAGQTYLSPRIAGLVVEDRIAPAGSTPPSAFAVLTPREREVLQLLAEGHTTKGIAASLGLSAKTVESHRRQIMHKLDLHSVAEITKYAVREGLTQLG